MRFTKSGKTLSGTWGVGIQIDNVPYQRPGNNAAPMADSDFVFQSEDSASPMIMRGYESGKAPEIIDRPGANFLRAGATVYGASLTPGGCRTNTGYRNADEVIVEVTPDDYVITVVHQVGQDLTIRSSTGTKISTIPTGVLYGTSQDRVAIRSLDDVRLAWIESDMRVHTHGIDHVNLTSAAFWVVPVEWHSAIWLLELGGDRLTFRNALRTSGYVVSTAETFAPDVVVVNGRVLVGWGVNQGESSVKVVEVDMDAPEVPLDNVPPPPPEKVFQAYPLKVWFSPFYSFSEKYGDTAYPIGNAQTITDDASDPCTGPAHQGAIGKTLAKMATKGFPLIIGDTPKGQLTLSAGIMDLTVGWWADGGTVNDLAASVSRCKARGGAKWIAAYFDTGDPRRLPETRPTWLTDDVWFEIQCYRQEGESLTDAMLRWQAMATRVQSYGLKMGLCLRTDCVPSLAATLEARDAYGELIRTYRPSLIQCFSDLRGSGYGCTPALEPMVQTLWAAVPLRPSRVDYFTPTGKTADQVTIEKLRQNIEMYQLSQTECLRLRKLLGDTI